MYTNTANDRLGSSGGGGIGGNKDRNRGVEARNAIFENSSELEQTPTPVDDESLLDTRIPEDAPVITDSPREVSPEIEIPQEEPHVITDSPHKETPEIEIPQEETPVITDSPQEETPVITDSPQEEPPVITDSPQEETPEVERPKEEPPVITDSPQEETPEIEIPQEETPVITDSPQEEPPVITDSPQEETPEVERPKEEPPVITDNPQEDSPEVERPKEETPVMKTSQEKDREFESPNADVPVFNGQQEEAPVIEQEQTVNEDVPEINDTNEYMYEHQNGTGNVENDETVAHEEIPLISDTNSTNEEPHIINSQDTAAGDASTETENGDAPAIKNNENEQTFEQNGHLNKPEEETKVRDFKVFYCEWKRMIQDMATPIHTALCLYPRPVKIVKSFEI